jgi:peptide/nickel transport system substrate-binding protein
LNREEVYKLKLSNQIVNFLNFLITLNGRKLKGGFMKSNRLLKVFGVLIVAVMILTACAPAATTTSAPPTEAAAPTTPPTAAVAPTTAPTTAPTEAPTAEAGKTTIIIGSTDPETSFDPADAYATHDWEILKNYDVGLLMWKPGELTLIPALATDMGTKSADGLTYTFTLKDGIKFGDGTPLDATEYASELNRMLTIGSDASCPDGVVGSLVTPFVQSIEAPDAKTIVFTLSTPVAYFPLLLATPPYFPANPKMFTDTGCNLLPEPPIYGVGPWNVTQFTANEQMVLEPNPYYTGDLKPQVDQIIIKQYADPNTMALAVQNGEIDIAWRILSPEQLTPLKTVSGLTVATLTGGGIRFLDINHSMAPFTDPNVAKAVASVIDRNAIADTVYSGDVTPIWSMVPPGFLGANEAFDTTYAAPNVDAAKQFLEASGYSASNPLAMDLYYPPEHYGASTAAAMELIKSQLEATGEIQVNLQSVEWGTYIKALVQGKYPIGILGWFFDFPDSSNYLDPFVFNGGQGTEITVAESGSATGIPITGTYETDATNLVNLLAQADIEQDITKRTEQYQQAQQISADLVLTVPLFYVPEHLVYRANIHGSSSYALPESLNVGANIEFNYSTLTKTP